MLERAAQHNTDDEDVTLIHKTPRKQEVTRDFTTKTIQQQLNEQIHEQQQQNKSQPTYEEDTTLEDDLDTYTPETDEKKLNKLSVIHIWPSDKHFKGTEDQAVLAKWHERSGHVCDQFILRTAKNSHGMEEVAHMTKDTRSHNCNACNRAKSKRKH